MGRPKKALKVKEPIRLRERKLANGNLGLYLDIYVKGMRKYESLGLYLIPEKTPLDKQMNIHTRQVAEKIKADRIIALQERGIKQYEKIKQSNMSLLDWLRKYEQEKFGFRPSTLKGRVDMRKKVEEYLEQQKTPYPLAELIGARAEISSGQDRDIFGQGRRYLWTKAEISARKAVQWTDR